jgi:polar amino acid transport system substrate-binding protein
VRTYLFLIVLLLQMTNPSYAKVHISVGSDTWQPYIFEDGSGLVTDIIFAVFKEQKIISEFQIMPFSRALRAVNKGDIDAVAALWWSAQRSEDILFSDPYFYNELLLVKKAGKSAEFKGLSGLENSSISIIRGYAYERDLKAIQGIKLVTLNNLQSALQHVYKNRVDATIGDALAIQYEIHKNKRLNSLQVLQPFVYRQPLHFGVRKNHPKAHYLINAFNQGLKKIQENGVYNDIITHHQGAFLQ